MRIEPGDVYDKWNIFVVICNMFFFTFSDRDWDFMPVRVWVGSWTALFILIIVAFDLSSLVRYITRFTEECFACLIALIFIYQAFLQLYQIQGHYPVHFKAPISSDSGCFCIINNFTLPTTSPLPEEGLEVRHVRSAFLSLSKNEDIPTRSPKDEMSVYQFIAPTNCSLYGGILVGSGCDNSQYVPDVFFLSVLLFIGTFTIATALVSFKGSRFCPTMVSMTIYHDVILSQ